jgi:chorismate mutase / prephenate dehydratase
MTALSPDTTLDAIRREIDSIDDQILDLLERRFAATGRVKATKASDGSIASSPFRPAREAAMLRRLIARAGEVIPPDVLMRFWRVILSASTQFQAPVTLHLDGALGGELGARLLIGQHFCGMGLKLHETPAEALEALRTSQGDLAIVDTGSAWAQTFLSAKTDFPKVIGTLPVIADSGPPPLLVFGHAEPQESGDDETLVLSFGETPLLPSALWHVAMGPFALTSLRGFLSSEDQSLRELITYRPGARIAGRCPRPIKVST